MVEQPPPIPNDSRPIVELVIEDMQDRLKVGVERYGTPLQAHNGRDALRDAYEESLDQTIYLRQAIAERSPAEVAAAGAAYLIWSNQQRMWWRANEASYTQIIDEAGRYTRSDAERIVAKATLDGLITHQRTDPYTGRVYEMADEVMVLAPESLDVVTENGAGT